MKYTYATIAIVQYCMKSYVYISSAANQATLVCIWLIFDITWTSVI